jgi:hypothetical protein
MVFFIIFFYYYQIELDKFDLLINIKYYLNEKPVGACGTSLHYSGSVYGV